MAKRKAKARRLSDVQLEAWMKAGKPVAGRSDGAGLTWTLSAKGHAAWVLRYKINGRPREYTIGRYPEIGLAKAREEADDLRSRIALGEDVAATELARRAEERAEAAAGLSRDTFADLARAWCGQRVNASHRRRVLRTLERHAFPALGALPREAVGAHHIDAVLRRTAEAAPTTANDLLRYLKGVFGWARTRRILNDNPAADFRTSDAGGREAPRQRALTLDEIRAFFAAMKATTALGSDNEAALRLLLLIGCRKGELVAARWEDFDLAAGLWRVPAERTKTRTAYTVPLPPQAVAILEHQRIRAGSSDWVFPARAVGKRRLGHISPDTVNLALGRVDHGLAPFVVHDLRRTMRSGLASLGVAPHVAERCLNHRLPGMQAVYDVSDYLPERRAALKQWADLLEATERGGQVVPLRPLRGKRPA